MRGGELDLGYVGSRHSSEPKHHIERPPLPWRRDDPLTECKLPAASYPTWTREEAVAVSQQLGKTRFAMIVCITCAQTADRHTTWDENPAMCLARYVAPVWRTSDAEAKRIQAELRAIAALIEAHRADFDGLLAGLGETVDLSDRRTAKRKPSPGGPK